MDVGERGDLGLHRRELGARGLDLGALAADALEVAGGVRLLELGDAKVLAHALRLLALLLRALPARADVGEARLGDRDAAPGGGELLARGGEARGGVGD